MKKEKVWFNWHCPHCDHRNRVTFPFQFEVPKYYSAEWDCDECGKTSKLEFNLRVIGWVEQKKPPRLRKRKQEKKQLKCKHEWKESCDHPGGSPYWKCNKCKACKDFTQKEISDGLKEAQNYTNNHGSHKK